MSRIIDNGKVGAELQSLESNIEKYFKAQCEKRGWLCLKFVSPSRRGVPDRLVIRSSARMAFVELKRPSGRLSRPQKAMIKRFKEFKVEVYVIWSKEEAQALIRRWEEEG